jgi:hypothetical protein
MRLFVFLLVINHAARIIVSYVQVQMLNIYLNVTFIIAIIMF